MNKKVKTVKGNIIRILTNKMNNKVKIHLYSKIKIKKFNKMQYIMIYKVKIVKKKI